MEIARLGEQLVLALPERGMPQFVSVFSSAGLNDTGIDAVLQRSRRVNGMDIAVPSAIYLPTGGMGYFGWPAIAGHRNGRDFIFEPSGWRKTESEDALALSASDEAAGLAITLHFRLTAVLAMRTEITNTGAAPYCLDRCMAATLLIPGGAAKYLLFEGGWGREFHTRTELASRKLLLQENRRGRTSHDRYPAIIVKTGGAVYGLHLGWSGNHVIAAEPTDDGATLVHAGELFEPGEMILQPGETYASPVAYGARAPFGDLDDLASLFHQAVREDILHWPGGQMKPRPVTLNTWEGIYFDHKLDALKAQASAAAAIGIERFVLDDGWFGRRDADNASLGDWVIDKRKYPAGLGPLIDHVTGLGMEFGIWFEPEMISADSDLFRAHPGWALQVRGRPLLESRQQLVLDLTRAEAADYLFGCIDAVLSAYAISCIKWDMNRDLTHAGDAGGRAAIARQTRAAYALMARVRAAHPHVEIEACASGGGRADYGVLRHTHRVWTSDCTDALERLSIQHGAALFLPPEILGCHISASPNHQTQRRLSLPFRAIAAFFGHLGVELNPLELAADERHQLAQWIALHKSLRHLLHDPSAHYINRTARDGRFVFGVWRSDVETGQDHGIIAVAQGGHPLQEQPEPLRLATDWPESEYAIRRIGPGPAPFVRSHPSQLALLSGSVPVAGAWISEHGLPVPQLYPESAILLEIKTVRGRPDGHS